jgi:hypothetical protein
MKNITRVSITKMTESNQRTTYFVTLVNCLDQVITPAAFSTGTGAVKGLSVKEARDRALIEAHEWAGFLGLTAEPFVEDGKEIKPTTVIGAYR